MRRAVADTEHALGVHAFEALPDHCEAYRRIVEPPLPEIAGFEARWNMPLVRHSLVLTRDLCFEGAPHFVVTYHLGGDRVRRVDPPDFDNLADRGALSLQAPGSSGRFESVSGRPVAYVHLYFQRSLLDEVAESYRFAAPGEIEDFFGVANLGCEADVSEYVRRALSKADQPTVLEMDSRAYLIALGLLRWLTQPRPRPQPRPGHLPQAKLKRILNLVEERLAENIRLADMAEAAGLSAFHFARQFRATTGETPAAYVIRRRVERARELLIQTRMTLPEIAFKVGFANQSHLNRCFKARFDETPGSLRRVDAGP
jgi:AraC family transcriptional regulator